MSPEQIGELLAATLGAPTSYDVAFDQVTVQVPREWWVEGLTLARDDENLALTFFDWLSAVDELDDGFAIVVHLWSPEHRHHLLLRTLLPREDAHLASATDVFGGANWHERETYEMFGVVFDAHPNLVPLLLPEGFEGQPLRKEFVLAARVAKAWPGAKEPGESDRDTPARRPMRPPGVPDGWGPNR